MCSVNVMWRDGESSAEIKDHFSKSHYYVGINEIFCNSSCPSGKKLKIRLKGHLLFFKLLERHRTD